MRKGNLIGIEILNPGDYPDRKDTEANGRGIYRKRC